MNGRITVRDFVAADATAVNDVALVAWAQYRYVFDEWEKLAASLANIAALASTSELIVAECAGSVVEFSKAIPDRRGVPYAVYELPLN